MSILSEINEEISSKTKDQILIKKVVKKEEICKNANKSMTQEKNAPEIIVLDDSDEDEKTACSDEIRSTMIKEEIKTEVPGNEYKTVEIKLESTEEYCDYDYSQLLDSKPQNSITNSEVIGEAEKDKLKILKKQEIEVTPAIQYSQEFKMNEEEEISRFGGNIVKQIKPSDFNDVWFLQATNSENETPIVMPVIQKVTSIHPTASIKCDLQIPSPALQQEDSTQNSDIISIPSDPEELVFEEDDPGYYKYPEVIFPSSLNEIENMRMGQKRGRPPLPVLKIGNLDMRYLSSKEREQFSRFRNNEASRSSRRIKKYKQLAMENLCRQLEIENWMLTRKLKCFEEKDLALKKLMLKLSIL